MNRILAGLGWLAFALLLLTVFLPKKELYFLGERTLESSRIVLTGENPSDLGLFFTLKGGTLYYENMAFSELQSVNLLTTLFYNRLWFSPFELGPEAAALFPPKIDRLEAWHTLFWPHVIFIKGEGAFGTFEGQVDLFNRKMTLLLQSPSEVQSRYRQIFNRMQPVEGGYLYELAF